MPRARRQPQPGRRPDARRNHVPLVRTRPDAAAARHGPAHCRRKREGATQFPTIGLFERNANNFKGTRNTKAQKSWSSRAEPEVRIHLPPAESPVRTCPGCRRSRREFTLIDGRHVVIVDEILPSRPLASVAWQMHTTAKIEQRGRSVTLVETAAGAEPARLFMRIVEPEGQVFATAAATPSDPPRQNPNDGVSKLTIDLGQ